MNPGRVSIELLGARLDDDRDSDDDSDDDDGSDSALTDAFWLRGEVALRAL